MLHNVCLESFHQRIVIQSGADLAVIKEQIKSKLVVR